MCITVNVKETKKYMEKYYDITETKPPNIIVKYFIENIAVSPTKAIELGCGAGRDTIYLIKNGWNVLAIDKSDVGKRISKRMNSEELKRFRFSKQKFEEVELEEVNLIVANFSLSFCDKNKFNELWRKIENSILPCRVFCG